MSHRGKDLADGRLDLELGGSAVHVAADHVGHGLWREEGDVTSGSSYSAFLFLFWAEENKIHSEIPETRSCDDKVQLTRLRGLCPNTCCRQMVPDNDPSGFYWVILLKNADVFMFLYRYSPVFPACLMSA